MADTPDLTLEVLRQIRDGVLATNARIDDTNQRLDQTNQRLDQTNQRLDQVVEAQIRTATAVTELRGEVGELRGEVGTLRSEVVRQGNRLDNALVTGGALLQAFRGRIERIERHTGLEPFEP